MAANPNWSHPPAGLLIRPARRRLLRATALLGLLGGLATALSALRATQHGAILPTLFTALIGVATLVAVAGGVAAAFRRRSWICLTPEGIEVFGEYGRYRVDWDNLVDAGPHLAFLAGLRLRSRAALLTTHQGTPRQRELLATAPAYGPWDLAFSSVDLDCGVDRFIDLLNTCRQDPERRAQMLRASPSRARS
ncbi:MAG: hypothetical protein HY320_10020 [Armatimonadetes bacterium]|nr:hypothetical protein [Armatimonadota bacterium]